MGKAAKDAALACAFDALPVTEVCLSSRRARSLPLLLTFLPLFQAVSVAHSVLRRCVDGGWLSMVCCLIQALHVPLVPVEDLCDFYKNPNVSYLRANPVLRPAARMESSSACDAVALKLAVGTRSWGDSVDDAIPTLSDLLRSTQSPAPEPEDKVLEDIENMPDPLELTCSGEDLESEECCLGAPYPEPRSADIPAPEPMPDLPTIEAVPDLPCLSEPKIEPPRLVEPEPRQTRRPYQKCPPPPEQDPVSKLSNRLAALEARVVDCDQAQVRFGILFEQFVQRSDGASQQMTRSLASQARSVEEAKKTISALVSVVGADAVRAAIQESLQQRQQPFGGGKVMPPRDDCGRGGSMREEHYGQRGSSARDDHYGDGGGWGDGYSHRGGGRRGRRR